MQDARNPEEEEVDYELGSPENSSEFIENMTSEEKFANKNHLLDEGIINDDKSDNSDAKTVIQDSEPLVHELPTTDPTDLKTSNYSKMSFDDLATTAEARKIDTSNKTAKALIQLLVADDTKHSSTSSI